MFERYNERARRVVFFARYEASQFGSPYIETEHILLGVLREDKVLTNRFLSGRAEEIRKQIESATTPREKVSTSVDLPISNENKRVLAYAAEEAERLAHKHIGTEHILLGLLREENSFAAKLLCERGLRISGVREALARLPHECEPVLHENRSEPPADFGAFLTKLENDRLPPCIGREKEIEQVLRILNRSSKKNVVLIGAPGVGKTAIVAGVVQRAADKTAPAFLNDMLFVSIDLGTLVAATTHKLRAASGFSGPNAVLAAFGPNTILVFDELHSLLALSGQEGAQEVTLLLKAALLEGTLQCIAMATTEDYHAATKKAPWLDRCFRAVEIGEPTEDESIKILQAIKGRFEKFHFVQYPDDTLKAAVVYASRYVKNRSLPDKAIDLIDDAGSCVKMKRDSAMPQELRDARKELQSIEQSLQDSVAHHQLEKARYHSEKERKQKAVVQELEGKYGLQNTSPTTVTVEEVEEALASWLDVPVASFRIQEAKDGDKKKQSSNPKGRQE